MKVVVLFSLGKSHSLTVRSSLALINAVGSEGENLVVQTGCLCSFHVLKIALVLTSKTWIVPVSSPATITRPSRRISALCAVSPNRLTILISFRVRMEKKFTRVPLVTANRSEGFESALYGGSGLEIWVMGLFEVDGISCWDLKVRQ